MYSYSEEYKTDNDIAKTEIIKLLKKKKLSKEKYDRCCKEIDILYEDNTLFIIYLLYQYQQEVRLFKYYFRGMYNSLLVLYELGISPVDPIKYNLHFELVRNCSYSLEFDIVDHIRNAFLFHMLKDNELEFTIVKGGFEEDDKDFALSFRQDTYSEEYVHGHGGGSGYVNATLLGVDRQTIAGNSSLLLTLPQLIGNIGNIWNGNLFKGLHNSNRGMDALSIWQALGAGGDGINNTTVVTSSAGTSGSMAFSSGGGGGLLGNMRSSLNDLGVEETTTGDQEVEKNNEENSEN